MAAAINFFDSCKPKHSQRFFSVPAWYAAELVGPYHPERRSHARTFNMQNRTPFLIFVRRSSAPVRWHLTFFLWVFRMTASGVFAEFCRILVIKTGLCEVFWVEIEKLWPVLIILYIGEFQAALLSN